MTDFAELLKYAATDSQREKIQAMIDHGSRRKAASALGVNRSVIDKAIQIAEARAAKRGHAPAHDMTKTVPDGFAVKGTSTLYGKDGQLLQWVKTCQDSERQLELMRAAIEALCADVSPLQPVQPPAHVDTDLMTVYPMGDPHIGMYAWAAEAGADFDLEIAERNLTGVMQRLVALSPASDTAMIVDVGDYFHADNNENRTQRSGNALDVDTRYQMVIQVGMRAMRRCIDEALTKHKNVIVVIQQGNHDTHSAAWLAVAINALYHNEPRVTVDMSPALYKYHQWGACAIGVTHGDMCKTAELGAIMATDKPQLWGMTEHRYWYTGHIHHDTVKELRGCKVESFRTLAARDAWHSASGYRAGRDMKAIILHKKHGEIERYTINLGMI